MLEGLAPKQREHICSLMLKAADELDSADLEILVAALEDKRFSNNGLAEALTEKGFRATETQIRRHRIKKCACAYVG